MPQTSTTHNLLSEPFICVSFKQRRRYSAKPANPSVYFHVTRVIFFFSPLAFIATFPVQVPPDQMLLRSNPAWKSNRFLVKITTSPIWFQSQNNHSLHRKKTLKMDNYALCTASEASGFPVTLPPRCISDPMSVHPVDVISIKSESKKTPQNPLCHFFLSCFQ